MERTIQSRPLGVIIIVVLQVLGGALAVLSGALLVLGSLILLSVGGTLGSIGHAEAVKLGADSALYGVYTAGIGVISFLLGATSLWVASSLWKLREIGRKAAIFVGVMNILLAVAQIGVAANTGDTFLPLIVGLLVNLATIFYLLQARVRAAFA